MVSEEHMTPRRKADTAVFKQTLHVYFVSLLIDGDENATNLDCGLPGRCNCQTAFCEPIVRDVTWGGPPVASSLDLITRIYTVNGMEEEVMATYIPDYGASLIWTPPPPTTPPMAVLEVVVPAQHAFEYYDPWARISYEINHTNTWWVETIDWSDPNKGNPEIRSIIVNGQLQLQILVDGKWVPWGT